MKNNQLKVEINNIRAIERASIMLNGITVIAGENGSGKSTISKLTYNLIKVSNEFDDIADSKFRNYVATIFNSLDQLTKDLIYFVSNDEYNRIRNTVNKIQRENLIHLADGSALFQLIDYLIKIFKNIDPNYLKEKKIGLRRYDRIKNILSNSINRNVDSNSDILELLNHLKNEVTKIFNKTQKIKDSRPLDVLDDVLDVAFNDNPIPNTFNIFEYDIPIIDRKIRKLLPLHSIRNVAYIDTPMILGLDFFGDRSHWEDLNDLLTMKKNSKTLDKIENIFRDDILHGDVSVNEDDISVSYNSFKYKREDGTEFDLLECATGLKSFAILQLLYKNGFLNSKSLLIIDEPEVHLHPQWVVEYARLIVLLNKHVGVKFLIASHHPDMISAIKYISEKESIHKDLNFYLANKVGDSFQYKYEYQGNDIDDIFMSFNIALDRIELYGEK